MRSPGSSRVGSSRSNGCAQINDRSAFNWHVESDPEIVTCSKAFDFPKPDLATGPGRRQRHRGLRFVTDVMEDRIQPVTAAHYAAVEVTRRLFRGIMAED